MNYYRDNDENTTSGTPPIKGIQDYSTFFLLNELEDRLSEILEGGDKFHAAIRATRIAIKNLKKFF